MVTLKKIVLFFCFFVLTIAQSCFASPYFSSSEHLFIGDNLKLYFTSHDNGKKGALLHLPSGLNLTYGEILSLGDFYGDITKAISQGASEKERAEIFITAFNIFAVDPTTKEEANKILTVIHDEQKAVEDGMKNGEEPEVIYKRIANETGRQFNCITGGGCGSSTWWLYPGRYLKLAEINYDHFGDNAIIAYQTGHQVALQAALNAHQKSNSQLLELAYAMNAFASHFLTDRFATGHIRTPRVELAQNVKPSVVGSLLATFMHSEDNSFGLRLHNLRGDHWIGYGDKYYFCVKNVFHRRLVEKAVQDSVNQIFYAYLHGKIPNQDSIMKIIPFADENNNEAIHDISTLFYWNDSNKKLLRRQDLSNSFDRHWTDNWWGWSTLVELQRLKGMPPQDQALLALSAHSQQALDLGLITDKQIVEFVKNKK